MIVELHGFYCVLFSLVNRFGCWVQSITLAYFARDFEKQKYLDMIVFLKYHQFLNLYDRSIYHCLNMLCKCDYLLISKCSGP